MLSNSDNVLNIALEVLELEAESIKNLSSSIDDKFLNAIEIMSNCPGHIVVTGMGKSGHIANKIAATLASTGTPAFFMHPAEASHGDLGMTTSDSVILALSNSGETEEVTKLLPMFKRFGIPLIAITSNPNSTLAKFANVHITVSVNKEACPTGLAPTASTTAALAMGDAIAACLTKTKNFTRNDFATFHPGGKLGKQLLTKIQDVMHKGNEIPIVTEDSIIKDVLVEVTQKRLGMTIVVHPGNTRKIVGVFTDGDLRRLLNHGHDINTTKVKEVMSENFKTVTENELAQEAINLMEKTKITCFPVVDDNNDIVGAFNVHDFLGAKII